MVAQLPGRSISALVTHLAEHDPFKRAIVLLPGHPGIMKIESAESYRLKGNFLIRSRRFWLDRETLVLSVDAPSDEWNDFSGRFRAGPRYAEDIRALAGEIEKAYGKLPLVLVGTSEGSVSAYHAARALGPDKLKVIFSSSLFENASNAGSMHEVWWVIHVLAFLVFLALLPVTMLRHVFTSPLNMYLRDRDRPKGAMRAMPNLMETELESFGASTVEEFTWKQLLDTDACTMCGRCTSVCPAHATGKPLDPREIVLKTGEVMAASGTPVVSPPISTVPDITISSNSVFERVTAEEVWSCTTCKACDEICPVNIEILDKILDMRRYLSLMESNFPTELGGAYRGMENSGNPWGLSQTERADWAKDLEGIEIIDGTDPLEAEYLYWVGCAGSFDDKNKKVTQAMAKLLQRAEVSFAILGPAENCTGPNSSQKMNGPIMRFWIAGSARFTWKPSPKSFTCGVSTAWIGPSSGMTSGVCSSPGRMLMRAM